jgi:hypothetical protein
MMANSSLKRIKLLFAFIMIFFLFIHFILPAGIFFFKGYVPTYELGYSYFDQYSMLTGAALNFFSCLIALLFIFIIPVKLDLDKKNLNYKSKIFFIFSVVLAIGTTIQLDSYTDSLKSLSAPTGGFIFLGMFFNIENYILFSLAVSPEFFPSSAIIFQMLALFRASRSAALTLILNLIYTLVTINKKPRLMRYTIYTGLAFLLSVFSFNISTNMRKTPPQKDPDAISIVSHSLSPRPDLYQRILGRLSYLDNVMMPVKYKKENCDECLRIFEDKYSFTNQFKIIVNNLVPGDVFEFDVYPNQYYRSAFMRLPEQEAKEHYTSINITLPVFLFMKTSFVPACFLAGIFFWLYYLFTLLAFKIHPLAGLVFISNIYSGLLTFFDFVMFSKFLIVGFISAILFLICSFLQVFIENKILRVNK